MMMKSGALIFVLLMSLLEYSNLWWLLGVMTILFFNMFMEYPLYEYYNMMNLYSVNDTMSILMIMLTFYLIMLMILSSVYIYKMELMKISFLKLMILLLISLYLSFSMSSFLSFYFMFEFSLLPTLLIILGWGYQPERVAAGVYFMMYTLMVSLPLFINLIYMDVSSISGMMWDSFYLGYNNFENYLIEYLVVLMMIMAFLVKLPMFLFHLWLPKAHVEAPVAGSMILAGVLLKLGGYGLYRVSMKFFMKINKLSMGLVSLSILGLLYISLSCCRLNDMKSLVAYSSVAHMGLVICGYLVGSVWGMIGAVILMVSHGLSSSGLFCFVNMVYERTGSRSLYLSKGGLAYIPMFSFFMFMLCCSNFSAPPSINFLSEVMLMSSLMGYEIYTMIIFPVGSFLGVVFSFYLYSFTQHGKMYYGLEGLVSGLKLDYHLMVLHILPINILLLKSEMFL